MKKTLTVGAGALALATLPVIGVFADANPVIDTVQVVVSTSCTFASGIGNDSKSMTIANGANNSVSTRAMTFSCNDVDGWKISAIGSGTTGHVNYMNAASPLTSSEDIVSATDGSTSKSAWAFKLSGSNIATGFGDWHVVPASTTVVATNAATISGGSITPTYRVHISNIQPAGTYTGKVTYTLAAL